MNTEMENNVVIVSACRTPFDIFGGVMRETSSIELATHVMKNVVERVNLPKEAVEEIIMGVAVHAELAAYSNIPARQAALKAGFPQTTWSFTIDNACCSSMVAFSQAYKHIKYGDKAVAMAVGSENLSNVSYLLSSKVRWGTKMGDVKLFDPMTSVGYADWKPVSVCADIVGERNNISRDMMDAWAYRSQMYYQKAKEAGKFEDEIVPYVVHTKKGDITVTEDQGPRADTTMEKLAKLRTVYGTKSITAGNAPGLNAGASAILLMSEDKAKEYGLKPLAYVRAVASAADDEDDSAISVARCIRDTVNSVGKTLDDLDVIEINEAFAVIPIVATKYLAEGDEALWKRLQEKTNVNGGAVAIGHPMGATGTRLIMTAMYELRRRGGGLGAAGICGGIGLGEGVLIEVV